MLSRVRKHLLCTMHTLKFSINFEVHRKQFANDLIKSKLLRKIKYILVLEQKVKTNAYVLNLCFIPSVGTSLECIVDMSGTAGRSPGVLQIQRE